MPNYPALSSGGGVIQGTAAARPAASAANNNQIYYATDTGEFTVSNGSSWQALKSTSNGFIQVGGSPLTIQNAGNDWTISTSNGSISTNGGGNGAILSSRALDVTLAGSGLDVKEGTNCKQGTATLTAGTVVVSNTSVTASSRIFLTAQSVGGTPGALAVTARTAGTSFTVTSSSNTDTSTFAYEIFEPG